MKSSQYYLLSVWAIALVLFLCWMGNVIPPLIPRATYMMVYIVSMVCLVLTFAGGFFALRLFIMEKPVSEVHVQDKREALKAYRKYANIRITLIAAALFIDLGACLMIPSIKGAKYYFLCALMLSVFCWPSKKHFRSVREGF